MSQLDFEKRLREEREKWESSRQSEDLKGMVSALNEKLEKLENRDKHGVITIRRQLVDANGNPLLNPDQTPQIQEIEVPASQASQYGLTNTPPVVQQQQPDTLKTAIELTKIIRPADDPAARTMSDKVNAMERELQDAKMKNATEGIKTEMVMRLDALTKQLEFEKVRQTDLKTMIEEAKKNQPTAQPQSETLMVAIEELRTQNTLTATAMNNVNKTVNNLISMVSRGNQTIPETAQGMTEDEKTRLAQFVKT